MGDAIATQFNLCEAERRAFQAVQCAATWQEAETALALLKGVVMQRLVAAEAVRFVCEAPSEVRRSAAALQGVSE